MPTVPSGVTRTRHVTADDMQESDGSGAGACEAASANVHMGRPARRVLGAGQGSVLAGFASAIYVESAAGIACLVPPTAPRGPLDVVLPAFEPGTPELPGAAWRTDGTTLAIDGHGTFALPGKAPILHVQYHSSLGSGHAGSGWRKPP